MVDRPWLIGVIAVPVGASTRWVHGERVRIAIEADLGRYALLDVIEVGGGVGSDEARYRVLEDLARRYPV